MEHRTTLCVCAGMVYISIALFGLCFVCRANCDHQIQELRMELEKYKWQLQRLKSETDSFKGERDESRRVTERITESAFDVLVRDRETSEKPLAFSLMQVLLIVISFSVCMCCCCFFGVKTPVGQDLIRAIEN